MPYLGPHKLATAVARNFKNAMTDPRHGDMADQAAYSYTEVDERVADIRRADKRENPKDEPEAFTKRKELGIQEVCTNCAGEISKARRMALPYTMICKECKEMCDS